MLKRPKLNELEFSKLPDDTVTYMTTYLSLSNAHIFATSSQELYRLSLPYKKDKPKALKELFQGVIDDHQDKVKAILENNPWLLLEKPGKNQTLRSEYTHQLFNVEGLTALQIALLRDQLEMTKLILPYFEKIIFKQHLKTTGAKEALKQWEVCNVIKEAKKERIKAYGSKMKLLIEEIAENKFNEIDFRTKLLPKEKAIHLESYVDIEALLLSAYQAYDDYFHTFKDWEQRDKFCIKVIGFLQSLLSPETAKVFCEGLYYVVEVEGRKPGDVAKSLKLVNEPDVSFYRSSIDSSMGLGFDFLIGRAGSRAGAVAVGSAGAATLFGKLCQSKTVEFTRLKSNLESGNFPTLPEREPTIECSLCLIL